MQPEFRTGLEPHCDPEHGCVTCGDVAEPMRVVRIDEERELALCETEAGTRFAVEIALVAPVEPGDELLVHAGTAIARSELAEEELGLGTPGREAEENLAPGTPGREAEEVPG